MQEYKKILGKVMMTAEGPYDTNKIYEPLSLITDEETGKSYISRKEVPVGTQINNREYWQPVASSGIIDNGVIILNRKNNDGQIPIYDLKSAAEAVAADDRKGGVILGFLGFNPEIDTVPTWKLYQYNDVSPSNWTNIDYWLPMDYTNKYAGWFDNEEALYDSVPFPKVGMYAYVGNSATSAIIYRCYVDRTWQATEDKAFGGVVNLADEEDITSKQNKLKFKDKEYNPAQFNGLGKIYLRKNIIDGKNVLTQTMMQATNTIYIIQYDYDLQGETITVPENCVLKFDGGSFINGTINGNNTSIDAIPTKIFDSVSGSWNIEYSYSEWFGAKADGITDCFAPIYKALNMIPYHCKLLRGSYAISNPIVMSYRRKLSGQQGDETKIIPTEGASMDCLILVSNSDGTGHTAYGHIRDLGVYSSPGVGIKCIGTTQGFNIENVEIKHCADAGLLVSKCWYASFKNINSWHNKYGLVLCASDRIEGDTAVNGIKFDTCWFNQNTLNSVFSNGHTTAVSFDACTFEGSATEGEPEIKCVHFYSDISLYSCYMETDRCGFDIKSDYRTGQFSIYGGIYHFRTPTTHLADLGELDVFNCIGSYWIINDNSNMPGGCIKSNASINNTSSRFPNSPNVWETSSNVININANLGGLYDTYYGCHARTWQTHSLKITHDGFAKNGSTAKFFLGINRNIHVDYDYGIRGLIIDQHSTGTASSDRINFKVQRTKNKQDNEDTTFMQVDNYGRVYFTSFIKARLCSTSGSSANRPAWSAAHVGTIYFDTDLGKPIFMKANGVWVDATGEQV